MDPRHVRELEHRAYRLVVDDGLVDILLGLFIMGCGVIFATDWNFPGTEFDIAGPITGLTVVFLWGFLKTRLIEPRIGYVRLRPAYRAEIARRQSHLLLLLVALVVALLVVVNLDLAWAQEIRGLRVVLKGLTFGIPVALAGPVLRLDRWLAYGTAIGLGATADWAFGLNPGTGWLIAGAMISIVGTVALFRFLRRHPLPATGAPDDD